MNGQKGTFHPLFIAIKLIFCDPAIRTESR